MKNFKKHMANEHPCLLAELENIRGEITSAGGPEWTTSTSDLQLTKSDDWKRNVLTANDFERIKNYNQIAISTTNEDTQCFRYAGDIPMFKTYESSGGMGEQSYRFCSLPVKASNGKFYTISFEMLKNINGVTCGYVVDCVSGDGGSKIVTIGNSANADIAITSLDDIANLSASNIAKLIANDVFYFDWTGAITYLNDDGGRIVIACYMKHETAVQGGGRLRSFVGENNSKVKILFNYATPANTLSYVVSI